MNFPLEEYLQISRELEKHAMLFNRLWEAGKPIFTDKIQTSAVHLNKENDCLEFQMNEKFWNSLDNYSKIFVISHECAHIALRHGSRGDALKEEYSPEARNIAMDISINHLLVNYFSFEREKISCEQILCWTDTVFPLKQKVLDNQAFEYYLEQMNSLPKDNNGIPLAFDDPSGAQEEIEKWLQEQIENGAVDIRQEDMDEVNKSIGSGSNLNTWLQIPGKPKEKKKWMTLVKNWNKRTTDEDEAEQWTKINRRYTSLSSEFFLPTDNSNDEFNKKKIKICLFLDVSGSCRDANTRFFKAAKSIPSKVFEIQTFVFDTETKKIDLKKARIPLGSGTNFRCIEDTLRKFEKYPEIVWIFTDGGAWGFSCRHPERWTWFLLPNSQITSIPEKSVQHYLSEFE